MNLDKPNAYLGDGVYITHDGYQYWLITSDGLEETNRIALEPEVLKTLYKMIERFERTKNFN